MKEIRALIVRMATGNANWGYSRIRGELKKVGHEVVRSTVSIPESPSMARWSSRLVPR